MKEVQSISNKILDELITTVEVIGIEKTIKTLQDAKNNGLIMNDNDIDFILESVSKLTSVSKERIINGNDRNDDRKIALAICVYFIKKQCAYSLNELKNIFNKDASQLSRYNSLVENMSKTPKTQFEKRMEEIVKKMKILLTQKKLENGK
jgi:hypothetical protein